MAETNEQKSLGPLCPSLTGFLLQVLGGLGGGIFGTLLMLVVFLLGSSILKPVVSQTIEQGQQVHAMFIFAFMTMIFLGALSSNCLSLLFIGLSDRAQYRRISSTIFQAFFINVIIFILLAPVYVIASKVNLPVIAYIAALQVILSAFASALTLKIIASHRYALLGVYSAILSILLSLGANLLFYRISGGDLTILLFVAIPVIWLTYGLMEGLVGGLYYWIYSLYGVDFLRSDISYGKDYDSEQQEVEALNEEEREQLYYEAEEDSTGADFLKKTK